MDAANAPAPNGSTVDSLPPETLQFAHRMFNAARSGDTVLLQAVDAGLPVNMTNDDGMQTSVQ